LEQDVLGLDVAVNDPALVREVERAGHAAGDLDRILDAELLLAIQAVAQRLALDERHHVIEEGVGFARVVQR
jgi:hypothetical protein